MPKNYRNYGVNPPPYGWERTVDLEVEHCIAKWNQACFALNDLIVYMQEQTEEKHRPPQEQKMRIWDLARGMGLVWDVKGKRFDLPEGVGEAWEEAQARLYKHWEERNRKRGQG